VSPAALKRLEAIVDRAPIAARIEARLPVGMRPRQLSVRTLLLGMLIALADARPAHLRRVHQALLSLPESDRWRLGVIARWKEGPHPLTYRQVERTFHLVVRALAKKHPDGDPSEALCEVMDALLEASVQVLGRPQSSSLAVDWTDYESFFRPPHKRGTESEQGEQREKGGAPQQGGQSAKDGQGDLGGAGDETSSGGPQPGGDGACADPEASWGHRRGDSPGQKDEAFFGYYLQAATIVKEESGGEVGELVRRISLTSCQIDPPGAFVAVLERMTKDAIALGDVLADSGYAYRVAEDWAIPLRMIGAALIQDLHPGDRGVKGTHMGAILANGNLHCPATPTALLELGPLAHAASIEQTAAHDQKTGELSRYKLSPISAYDQDGYRRVACPAAAGKLRCPLRPASMELSHTRPQVLTPPDHPPVCCSQQTITVPAQVNAKTQQKHDYPSRSHRLSYNRRSAAERTFSTIKDPATNDISAKGWCRLAGIVAPSLFLTCLFIVRNVRVADAFDARQAEQARRQACERPPRTRRRRRETIHDLLAAANAPPA
jgi:hypothetical protein